ncbi:Surface antigen [Poseidonocella sedimentorum]|uniref:Surface antigen n=1 Tax=Poseidonocella sedimentorum TaxID=871652 RepID=A0A1I6EE90_9RHOB|nr:Surface antigen [Poseidonocella sedimentorum]
MVGALLFAVMTTTAAVAQSARPAAGEAVTPGLNGPEGELSFGLWYSEAEEFSATTGFTQHRIGGRDDSLAMGLSLSRYATSAHVTLTDPDFYESPYARVLSFAIRSYEPGATQAGDYTFTQAEALIGFSRALDPRRSIGFGAGFTRSTLDDRDSLPEFLAAYVESVGEEINDAFVYADYVWDARLSEGWQRRGPRVSLNTQLGRAGDTSYGLAYLRGEYRAPFGERFELRTHGAVGLGDTLSDGPFPVLRSFAAGGPGSVRGFAEGTLGPQSPVPGSSDVAYPGGQFSVLAGLEAATPLDREQKIFGMAYFDIGNVYETAADYDGGALRRSVGIGISWASPIGPLSLFVSEPIDPKDGDEVSRLQFGLGLRF